MKRIQSIFVLTAITGLTMAVNGCASYVNVPPEPGDAAIHDLNTLPTPLVMAEAMAYAVRQNPAGESVAFALPVGSSESTYGRAWRRVDPSAPQLGALEAVESGRPLYQLIALRVRSSRATTRILLPESAGERRMLEVGLRGGVSGWRIETAHRRYPTADDMERAEEQLDRILTTATMTDGAGSEPEALDDEHVPEMDEPIETESTDDEPDELSAAPPLLPVRPANGQ